MNTECEVCFTTSRPVPHTVAVVHVNNDPDEYDNPDDPTWTQEVALCGDCHEVWLNADVHNHIVDGWTFSYDGYRHRYICDTVTEARLDFVGDYLLDWSD